MIFDKDKFYKKECCLSATLDGLYDPIVIATARLKKQMLTGRPFLPN